MEYISGYVQRRNKQSIMGVNKKKEKKREKRENVKTIMITITSNVWLSNT